MSAFRDTTIFKVAYSYGLRHTETRRLDAGRSRALREMLLQAPPPVVAGMLGYSSEKAEPIAAESGATWKHYASGSRRRVRHPRP